ncbi:LysR substrate-binding domain-containing protein [Neisseria sp. Ec49-e6-T10]|uniref:LysR substrate-binding domain-containing protein n=1 Tax=Neisseria sp. Ec49-e6-T10 TaxID=3140744 RepID=UPI003EB9BE5D
MNKSIETTLNVFRLVAEYKSFTRAAADMDISPSALSQSIRQLEQTLGVRLLNRSTRSVSLTEIGQQFLVRISPALDELREALEDLPQTKHNPTGTLKVTMPYIVWQSMIEPRLADFMARYPDIRLDVQVDDGLTNIVQDGFDVGIRLGQMLHQDMIALPFGLPIRSVIAATPRYFEQYAHPQHPYDLLHHRCLCYRFNSGRTIYHWEFYKGDEHMKFMPNSVLTMNKDIPLNKMAQQHIGLINAFEPDIRNELAQGIFMPTLTDWHIPETQFYLYYPSRHFMPNKLKKFIDYFR